MKVLQDSFENQDEIENQIIDQIRSRACKGYIAVSIFALFVATLALYRYYSTAKIVTDGLFYQNELMSLEMLPFWKELGEEEINSNKQQLIEEGQHKISRQELGHMGWTMLHMMTGSFPQELTPTLVQKWNTFLVLFGHLYPCKLCSTHFLKMLAERGPFEGNTKQQLMIYLCEMHNQVNQRLGKPIHDCAEVKEEWNTCGCSGQL